MDDNCLHLSTVTLAEIQAGIEPTRQQDLGKANEIEAWLDLVTRTFNILPIDGPTFRCWARLMQRQSDTLYEDAMIAATAQIHKLTVVTWNLADFQPFGIPLFNPFSDQPTP